MPGPAATAEPGGPLAEITGLPPGSKIQVETELQEADTTTLERMATEGHFLDSALAYIKLAAKFPSPLREHYTLRAAELLMTGNYVPQAAQLLQDIDRQKLSAEFEIRHSILSASIALARENPQATLDNLGPAIFFLAKAYPGQLAKIHRLRAIAFEQVGNLLEATHERVELGTLLSDPEAIEQNQQAILQTLKKLSPEVLLTMRTSAVPDIFTGWLELAVISQGDKNIQQSSEQLIGWRQRYPQHPALDSILDSILATRPPAIPLPEQVALILPLKNRFAKAASAVRDGFLAAYYAQQQTAGPQPIPGSYIPRIKIYDEGENPLLIDSVYTRAVNEGAQFVVGPLNKEAVNRLAQFQELPVPTLALNFSETPAEAVAPATGATLPAQTTNRLYQISLSPEHEARQLADRAWLDGHVRSAIITPDTSWGKRVTDAFRDRWLEFGGEIVEESTYDIKKSDYSLPIRQLLNVDESEQRKTALRRLLGKKLEFTPRRRQDIDFIFMAAPSRQARLIRPQLRFHHATKLPVYATSHSYSGSINAAMDRDMDGVLFADIPWTLGSKRSASALKHEIQKIWPAEEKFYSRLYALGVDAYNIIGKLEALGRSRTEYFAGETGNLYLDADNRLQRRLLWAKFKNGVPRIIDGF